MPTINNQQFSYNYDPTRQGYDTNVFKTVSGSPSISSGAIRLNAAKIIAYGDLLKATQSFNLKVPTAPTSGDVRVFGLSQINAGATAVFKITDAVFSCETTFDGVTKNEVVTWQSNWTNTYTTFKIVWTGFSASFYVNGVRVAFINDSSVPKVSMSSYLYNGNSDNMDLYYMTVEDGILHSSDTLVLQTGDIEIGAVELKDGATDTRATINAANTARTSATTVVAVQPLDETGAIIKGGGASVTAQYISPTDFTATYTSASTITLTGLPYTLTSGSQVVYVKVRNTSTNVTTTYVAGSNNYGFGYSAGVVTIYLNGSAASVLTTNDTYEVGLNGPMKTYDTTTDTEKVIEQSPLSAKYVIDSLVDTTNSSGTVYYPSSTGMSMDGYRSVSFSGKFIDADNTTTMTIEALNDEDSGGDWQDVTQCFNNDKAGVATSIGASVTVTSGTVNFAISREDFNYSLFRVKVVYGDATNTSIIKLRRKAM